MPHGISACYALLRNFSGSGQQMCYNNVAVKDVAEEVCEDAG
jgi:hypothetical protein